MKHRLILAALATVLFTAQAEAQRQRSEALEIARATHLGNALRDVPREDLEEAMRGSPDMTINYALDAVGVATGVFDQATSLSRLGEGSVFAALAFFAPKTGPETTPAIFGWMPREDAGSAREANALFQDLLIGALQDILPTHRISLVKYSSEFPFNIRLDGAEYAPCGMYSRLFHGPLPSRKRAPTVMGGYPAYRWGGPAADAQTWGYPLIQRLSVRQRLEFYAALSLALPDWAYIYLPPSEMLLNFPLMFNEGEPLYFIEPASEDEEAG